MNTSQRKGTGQCLCGQVCFSYRDDPLWVGHCHCQSCRRNTGCAVATFVGYHPDNIHFTKNNRNYYSSSTGVRRSFCANCGTPISYEADHFPGEIHLYVSAFDRPEEFPPSRHVHFEEKIHWFDTADDLPRVDKGGIEPTS